MKEFAHYESAFAVFHRQLDVKTLPLQSWDVFTRSYTYQSGFKDDLNRLKKLSKQWVFSYNYFAEFAWKHSVIIVTTPQLNIVYASGNIEKMNGYTHTELIGKSPRIFQGEGTCLNTIKRIRKAVDNQQPFEASLLNYRKDKSTYICVIKGLPIRDKNGTLVNYIAFEKSA